jgi:hypothetical protein
MQGSRALIAALLGLLMAACAPVAPSASPQPVPSGTLGAAPSSVAVPSTAAFDPCREAQVVLTPGQSGAAAGTSYLRVFIELAQGPACTLPRGPMVTVTTDDGTEVARATKTDSTLVVLDYITGYYIAWNAPCGPTPTGSLVAQIAFTTTLVVELPIGSFRPSCVDGSTGSLSMTADDRS